MIKRQEPEKEMKLKQHNKISESESKLESESGIDIANMLKECIGDGTRLADRIIDAARQATAYHMLIKAQEMQSAVEAEYSTRYHAGFVEIEDSQANRKPSV